MKNKSKIFMLLTLCLSFSLIFNNCGDSDEDKGPSLRSIATPEEGGKATSVAMGAMYFATDSANLFAVMPAAFSDKKLSKRADFINNPFPDKDTSKALSVLSSRIKLYMQKAKAVDSRAIETEYCYDGGYITINDDGAGNLTITFSNCKEGSEIANGTAILSVTQSSVTLTMGTSASPLTFTGYTDSSYSDISYRETYAITISIQETSSYSFTLSVNGYMKLEDMDDNEAEQINFSNYTAAFAYSEEMIDGYTYEVLSLTLNGSITDTEYTNAAATTPAFTGTISLSNFTYVYKFSYYTYFLYETINGTISVSTNPSGCFDGTFSFVTDVPLKFDYYEGHYVDGQMTINGSTVITFNADGSITITVGGSEETYDSVGEINDLCD